MRLNVKHDQVPTTNEDRSSFACSALKETTRRDVEWTQSRRAQVRHSKKAVALPLCPDVAGWENREITAHLLDVDVVDAEIGVTVHLAGVQELLDRDRSKTLLGFLLNSADGNSCQPSIVG